MEGKIRIKRNTQSNMKKGRKNQEAKKNKRSNEDMRDI
jgi:hypothetical protein